MIEDLLLPDRSLREVRPGIHSVLSPEVEEAMYDSRAEGYDQVVGSWWYNRLMWGVSTDTYRRFVRRALGAGDGPLLDVGAGSAVFTAGAYVQSSRRLILIDRSVGMLEAARDRIARRGGGSLPDRITLLQADAKELPLQNGSAETVLSMALFHVIEDLTTLAEELFRVLRPGGTLFATSLVTERAVGRLYLRLLHRAGEVASPKAQEELRDRLESALGHPAGIEREGSMAFLHAEKPPRSQGTAASNEE
jgi:ubiquinone/menaquinone biosynthesis C-methylase UbiE